MRRLALIALLFAPLLASAHATGFFFQQDIDGYTVDIGYTTLSPAVGESVLFDFLLKEAGTDTAVPFDDVWVKIEKAGTRSVVLASGIHNAPFGGSRLSYVFPEAGDYVIAVRYETDDASLVETSFPLTVTPGEAPFPLMAVLAGCGGFALGALAVFFLRRRSA